MTLSAVRETMLYCPKCQSKYPAGSRRFCDNDGARLASAPVSGTSAKPQQQGGVFTNLLGRTVPTNLTDEKLASTPKFVPFNPPPKTETDFTIPNTVEAIKSEQRFEPKPERIEPPIEKSATQNAPTAKPYARIIIPSEIASGTAEVGDRKTNPTGRLALTWEQPGILVGQMIKGRYQIIKLLGQDEESISYLAEDKIVPNKKVFVRVFMDEDTDDDFSNVLFAEERVSLSHINHPNIAKVVDSGELLEGKPFIVTEFIEGKTIKDMLGRTGQFNSHRTARIIRQASYALSEAHQNGVLHRNLKPESVFLGVSEAGTEQVKLTNFGGSYDKINEENFAYKSPEQIDGKLANYASDIYSLGVIAYQMLTNRLPFNSSSVTSLKKAQREGLTIFPTNLRLDVPPLVDDILTKALTANPADRYPKARDFGDAFFNALITVSPWETGEKAAEKFEPTAKSEPLAEKRDEKNYLVISPITFKAKPAAAPTEEIIIETPTEIDAPEENFLAKDSVTEVRKEKIAETSAETLPWKKRSPDTVRETSPHWLMLGIFALALLVFLGVWYYILNRPSVPEFVQTPVANNQPVDNTATPESPIAQTPSPAMEEIEIPPNERTVEQPANTVYFQNTKQDIEGNLAKNFLGFSLYYPNDWIKSGSKTDFLDISKKSADNLPVKQILITRYESRGTFNQDKPNFAKLVENSNQDLKTALPNYRVVGTGETTIQNGRWKAYQVQFENSGTIAENGELTLWGRRLWIPIQRPGMKSGFVITLIATSLAPNVKSVEDFVSDEELAQILETFEPTTSY